MLGARVDRYTDRIREELKRTFTEDHTPGEIAGSFALGTFITMLPTLGVGVIVFVVLAFVFDRLSKIALFASILVFNPIVKWGVYVGSFALGVVIFGPVEGVSFTEVSLDAGPDILLRLLVGNLILAVVVTVPSYVVVHRFAVAYRQSQVGEIVEEAIVEVIEETLED